MNFTAWLFEGKRRPESTAVIADGTPVSYRELWAAVGRAADLVRQAGGGRPQPLVPVLAANSPAQIAACLGVIAAGGVVAAVPDGSAESLRAVFGELSPELVFADREHAGTLKALGLADPVVLDEALGGPAPSGSPPAQVGAGQLAAIMYTSGSTGRPRGVMVSHQNLISNTAACVEYVGLASSDRALISLPFTYCYGASVLYAHLRAAASVVLHPLTFPEAALDAIVRFGVTGLPGVPSTFNLLLRRSTLATRGALPLRYLTVSGGRLANEALAELQAAVPSARVYVRYGVTETTALTSWLPPDRWADKLGSIGRGLPGAPLSVVREDGAAVLPGSGEVGEILIRGAHVTGGYFKDEAGTAAVFRSGGFHTGDLATVDAEGFVTVVGRAREFVKVFGHRVGPQEVEDVISSHPSVSEVAVFGIPDPTRGEALVAAVVCRPGLELDEGALGDHCSERLPAHKVPKEFRLVERLPRGPSGKLQRRQLPALLD